MKTTAIRPIWRAFAASSSWPGSKERKSHVRNTPSSCYLAREYLLPKSKPRRAVRATAALCFAMDRSLCRLRAQYNHLELPYRHQGKECATARQRQSRRPRTHGNRTSPRALRRAAVHRRWHRQQSRLSLRLLRGKGENHHQSRLAQLVLAICRRWSDNLRARWPDRDRRLRDRLDPFRDNFNGPPGMVKRQSDRQPALQRPLSTRL